MSGMGAAFTGAGKNRPLLYASLVGQWGFLVPLSLLVTLWLSAPVFWLWMTLLIGDAAEMIVRWYLYRKTNWIESHV